jgi:glycosyltransferase involved in cell wall biosynthesis
MALWPHTGDSYARRRWLAVRVLLLSKAMLAATAQKKADLLAAQPGVDLTLVSPPYWRADDGGHQFIEVSERRNWRMVEAPLWLNGHFHLHVYPTLGRLMREHAPDLVHIDEEPYNLATFHAMLLARRQGARTVFFAFQNLYRAYPPPFSWLEQYDYRHADYALAGNEDAVTVLRRKGYRGPAAVIPQFGVDTDLFAPHPHPENDPPRIGYVGRLVPQKGVDCLLRAYAPLAARAELVIAGRGPSEPDLRALAQTLGIDGRVRFVGSLGSRDVAALMADLDVLVLPSRTVPNWAEQFGRVLVEAMACEVAVVGSSSYEIPHVIADAGLIFPEDDVAALTERLSRLLDDPAMRRALARKGRERVLAHYTQERIAADTYAVWRAVLTSSGASAHAAAGTVTPAPR